MVGYAACGGVAGLGEQLKQLYVTDNAGRTWRWVRRADFPVGGYLSSVSFADRLAGLLVESRGGLLATGDGGRTWHRLLLTSGG